MLMNIPDNIKKSRGLCKPPRFRRVAPDLVSRQQERDYCMACVLQEALWAPQFWNSNMLVPAELWMTFHFKFISKIPIKGWLPQSCHQLISLPITGHKTINPGHSRGWAQRKQVVRSLVSRDQTSERRDVGGEADQAWGSLDPRHHDHRGEGT